MYVCVCMCVVSTSEMAGGSPQRKHPISQTTVKSLAHLQVIEQCIFEQLL